LDPKAIAKEPISGRPEVVGSASELLALYRSMVRLRAYDDR